MLARVCGLAEELLSFYRAKKIGAANDSYGQCTAGFAAYRDVICAFSSSRFAGD